MSGLLRAEWLRLRRRRDLWLVGVVIVGMTALSYGSTLASQLSGAGVPPGFEVSRDALAVYAVPQSFLMVLQNGQFMMLALVVYLAAATVGAEFNYGTVRTSLVARSDRSGFLVVRLGALALTVAGILVALLVLGLLLPGVAALAGAHLPPAPGIDGLGLFMIVVALFAFGVTVATLATVAALLARNAGLALLVVFAYAFVESMVVNLGQRGGETVAVLARLLPLSNAASLTERAHVAARPLQLLGTFPAASGIGEPPLPAELVAGALWVALAAIGALWLFRRAEIRE